MLPQASTFSKGSFRFFEARALDLTTTGATTGATSFSAATDDRVPSTPWETQNPDESMPVTRSRTLTSRESERF